MVVRSGFECLSACKGIDMNYSYSKLNLVHFSWISGQLPEDELSCLEGTGIDGAASGLAKVANKALEPEY